MIHRNAVIEAMETCRAMRFMKADPVPDDLLETVLYAATRASNPNNTQAWDFVVVRDADIRQRIADAMAPFVKVVGAMPAPDDATDRRTLRGAANIVATMATVPIIIFVVVRNVYPPQRPAEEMMWSAGFAASQNLIVAARSLGLGTVFSTLHRTAEPAIREILGLPDDVAIATTIPLGWPDQEFGPVTRKPVEAVVHHDHW